MSYNIINKDGGDYVRMILKENLIREDISKAIVTSISNAIGDDINEDIKQDNLITKNYVPTKIWDFINKRQYKRHSN